MIVYPHPPSPDRLTNNQFLFSLLPLLFQLSESSSSIVRGNENTYEFVGNRQVHTRGCISGEHKRQQGG